MEKRIVRWSTCLREEHALHENGSAPGKRRLYTKSQLNLLLPSESLYYPLQHSSSLNAHKSHRLASGFVPPRTIPILVLSSESPAAPLPSLLDAPLPSLPDGAQTSPEMASVPKSSTERAPVPTSCPKSPPVPMSGPERAPVPKSGPGRAVVPTSGPGRASDPESCSEPIPAREPKISPQEIWVEGLYKCSFLPALCYPLVLDY
ncbi:hypothetical protein H4Q32_011370 [Labeo rohita]|uniref:Uncharacterized protein n=1 Tax=Labeo rohita TaxID=84645 RepID=A0ABQ8LVF8_LABRO|nr:hypothetical protein H4Q32_011370 [Labeo rohita]